MIFDHLVKHNGVYYPAGTDVPVEEEAKEEQKIVQDEPTEVKEEPKEEEVKFPYSKTQINRMSTSELKAVAKKYGLNDKASGSEIKTAIIKKYL